MSKLFFDWLSYSDPLLCLAALIVISRAKAHRSYLTLTSLLAVRMVAGTLLMAILQARGAGALSAGLTYQTYFYLFWISFVVETTLSLYVILNIFRSAMAPLKGLRTLGMLVFRWAAAISVALSIAVGFSPHQSATSLVSGILVQFLEITSVITLCLLLFVCFAIKPLGLTFRSRIFGVALGLGIGAASNLVGSAWVGHQHSLYSAANVVVSIFHVTGLVVWSAYFFLPEPKRKIIVLPTTSPFLRWNQISEVLGDDPGFVAIAGIPPEVFSPAEIEIMTRASIQMQRLSEFDPVSNVSSTFSGLSA